MRLSLCGEKHKSQRKEEALFVEGVLEVVVVLVDPLLREAVAVVVRLRGREDAVILLYDGKIGVEQRLAVVVIHAERVEPAFDEIDVAVACSFEQIGHLPAALTEARPRTRRANAHRLGEGAALVGICQIQPVVDVLDDDCGVLCGELARRFEHFERVFEVQQDHGQVDQIELDASLRAKVFEHCAKVIALKVAMTKLDVVRAEVVDRALDRALVAVDAEHATHLLPRKARSGKAAVAAPEVEHVERAL